MNIEELKRLAEPLVNWNANSAWEGPLGTAILGHVDNEDNQYEVASFDLTMYDGFEDDSLRMAQYYAAANPAAILELIRQRDAAIGGLELFMDVIDPPPERNCSCHISPPCNDCVENSGLREAFEYAERVIANAEKTT